MEGVATKMSQFHPSDKSSRVCPESPTPGEGYDIEAPGPLKHSPLQQKPDEGATVAAPKTGFAGKMASIMAKERTAVEPPRCICCCAPSNRIRHGASLVVARPEFDHVVLGLVFLNMISLAMYDPMEPSDSSWNLTLSYIEAGFSLLFGVEMAIKIIALDLNRYWKDGYNRLDACVVVAGFVTLIPNTGVESISAIRAVRILKPLRFMSKAGGMRNLVDTILSSSSAIGNVLLVMLFTMSLFALFGAELCSGSFRSVCYSSTTGSVGLLGVGGTVRVCSGSGHQCATGYYCQESGENPWFGMLSFDNVLASFLVMIQIMTLDGWCDSLEVMFDGNGYWLVLFEIVAIFCLAFFLTNLIGAVLAAHFSIVRLNGSTEIEEEDEPEDTVQNTAQVAPAQQQWGKSLVKVSVAQAYKSMSGRGECSDFLRKIHQHWIATATRHGLILSYATVLATQHYPSSATYDTFQSIAFKAISVGFLLDELLWISAEGKLLLKAPKGLRARAFDWLEVLLGITTFIDAWFLEDVAFVGGLLLFRALRVFVSLRVISVLKPLKVLLKALESTISSVGSFLQLLSLMVFVFALLGLHLFGGQMSTFEEQSKTLNSPPPSLLQSRANFDNFPQAVLSVFQVLTLEWVGIGYRLMADVSPVSVVYFIVLIITGNLLMLNLFMAVLVDAIAHHEGLQNQGPKKEKGQDDQKLKAQKRCDNIRACQAISARLKSLGYSEVDQGSAMYAKKDAESLQALVSDGSITESQYKELSSSNSESAPKNKAPENALLQDKSLKNALLQEKRLKNALLQENAPENALLQDRPLKSAPLKDRPLKNAPRQDSPLKDALLPDKAPENALLQDKAPENALLQEKPNLAHAENVVVPVEGQNSQLAGLFQIFDTSGDGLVDKDEFQTGMQSLGCGLTQQEVEELYNTLDSDGDGEIDLGEFSKLLSTTDRMSCPSLLPAITSRCLSTEVKFDESQLAAMDSNLDIGVEIRAQIHLKAARLMVAGIFSNLKIAFNHWKIPDSELETDLNEGSALAKCRRWVRIQVVETLGWELISISLVLFSCVLLALQDPTVEAGSDADKLYDTLDFTMTILFTLEALIKIGAQTASRYFSESWNRLDFFIVLVSLAAIPLGSGLAVLKALRSLRALRLISRTESLKLVVETVVGVIPELWPTLVFSFILWTLFAEVGVHLMAGRFWHCSDGSELSQAECTGTFRFRDEVHTRVWQEPPFTFNDLGNAFLTLFYIATFDNWAVTMYFAMDSTGVESTPEKDNHVWLSLYFLAFVILGALLVLNLIIGKIVNLYTKLGKEGTLMMTPGQCEWILAMRLRRRSDSTVTANPPAPQTGSRFRLFLYEGTCSPWFDRAVYVFILLNTLVVLITYYGMNSTLAFVLEVVNQTCGGVFVLEALVKIVAWGPSLYFLDSWCRFDFLIVVSTVIGFAISSSSAAHVFRALRLLRVVKLVKKLQGLQEMFTTLLLSLPALGNIAALMFLFVFIWSCIGMSVFGKVARGTFVTENFNFDTIGASALTMARVLTGDGWTGLHGELMLSGANKWISGLFFMSFTILTDFIMLNILIAVILLNFQDTATGDGLLELKSVMSITTNAAKIHGFVGKFSSKWKSARSSGNG